MPDWPAYVRDRLQLEELRPERAAEIAEDIGRQLEQAYQDALRQGLTEAEAEKAAAEHVTDWEALAQTLRRSSAGREDALARLADGAAERRARGGLVGLLAGVWQDALYGLRLLGRNRGFAAVAIATLAMGIGANVAVFRVTDTALFRPLPYPHADKLVELDNAASDPATENSQALDPMHWWNAAPAIDSVATYSADTADLDQGGTPQQIVAALTTAQFFRVMGVQPLLGRTYTAEEAGTHAAVAVVGYTLWRERLGGTPRALGMPIHLNGREFRVIGVMPRSFSFPTGLYGISLESGTQVWIPYPASQFGFFDNSAFFWQTIARLRPWASLVRACSDLNTVYERIAADHPDIYPPRARLPKVPSGVRFPSGVDVTPLRQALYGRERLSLLLLLLSAGMVWLVACANLGGLMLARTTARQGELAIRAALGASPWRLMRLLWLESLALAAAAGTAGVALAWAALRALLPWAPTSIAGAAAPNDWPRIAGFVLGLTFLSTLLFGLAPAVAASWPSLRALIETGMGSRTTTPRRQRARQALLGAETALTLALLVAAGLLTKSFWQLSSRPEGFDSHHVLIASVPAPSSWRDERKEQFYATVIERIAALPGVETAAAGSCLPAQTAIGVLNFAPGDGPTARVGMVECEVSTSYFRTLRIPVLMGRAFASTDGESGQNTSVLSAEAAKMLWPGKDPDGRVFGYAAGPSGQVSHPRRVVGVVADTLSWGFHSILFPVFYVPYRRGTQGHLFLLARTTVPPDSLAAALRSAVWSVDKSVPVTGIETLAQAMAQSISAEHFRAWLCGSFAALALALACVGIFGVVSYDVTRRTREFGIRMALGAHRGQLTGLMLRRGMLGVWTGAAVGLVGAFALARWLASLLFQLRPFDPGIFAGATLLVLLAATAAASLPARRAARVDPSVALRYE